MVRTERSQPHSSATPIAVAAHQVVDPSKTGKIAQPTVDPVWDHIKEDGTR